MLAIAPLLFALQPLVSQNVPQPAAAATARRRAVGHGPAACTRPTLVLTFSKPTACSGESVTLSWQASDPPGSVSIITIGSSLPASGSMVIQVSPPLVLSGHAANSCGTGSDVIAELRLQPDGSAFVSANPTSIQQGQTAIVGVSVSNIIRWTLSSALGNALSASSGNGNASVTYTGSHTGFDTVTLNATTACGALQSTTFINVNAPQQSGNLRCCDGTISPTCNNCAKKQGCCSSHGGVCGCP